MGREGDVEGGTPAGGDGSLTFTGWDAALVLACSVAFTVGARLAAGSGTPAIAAALLAVCGSCYLAGSMLLCWPVLRTGTWIDFPLKFLAGYVVVSTSLFALAWLSPLSIGVNFALLVTALLAGAAALRPTFQLRGARPGPAAVATLVAIIAALLWAQDSIRPTETLGEVTVFKPWIDGFYHAVHVRIFSDAHGAASVEDFRLAGVPTRPYHYVSYMIPALVRTMTGIRAYAAFAGLMVPMGIALTGLAAYALAASWWGAWSGLCATMVLLLLPDGAQQGGGNGFLGYHWMQAVGPAGLYGTSVLALAWIFVLRGGLAGRWGQLLAGWCLAAVAVGYKAQLFVANAFLLWMLPPLLFRGLARRTRLAWAASALGLFLAVAAVADRVPGVPVLRLDGSASIALLSMVRQYAQPVALTGAFDRWVVASSSMAGVRGLGAIYLLLAVLGLLALAYPVLAVLGRRRTAGPLLALPALAWITFSVMALGLAMDDRGVGMREELLHRPFIWVYFLTAVWVGGALGWLLLGGSGRAARVRRGLVVVAAALLLAVPARLGEGLQRLGGLPLSFMGAPTGLVRAAEYVRAHADRTDLVQDSANDGRGLVGALSERRLYVVDGQLKTGFEPAEIRRRVEVVARLKATSDQTIVEAATRQLGIRWFILAPGDRVGWPAALLDRPVFEAGGYRVLRFY
jgi:hypothetical protein